MSDGDEEYRDQYDVATFRRRVLSVSDPSLRRRQVERHVLTVDAPTVVDHLQQVMRAAALGSADDAEIVLTFAEFIGRASGEESLALEALDLEARDSGRHAVAWMLLEPRPARSIDHRALTQMQRQAQSLGYRKAQAMKPDPRWLDQLARDDHWMVIEKLCQNPRTSEAHIMTVVTRRPTIPELIDTVAGSLRWYRRPSIREAIVMNPYADTGLCLRTLATLSPKQWTTVQHAQQVHEAVRRFAQYLSSLRVAADPEPGPDSLGETIH